MQSGSVYVLPILVNSRATGTFIEHNTVKRLNFLHATPSVPAHDSCCWWRSHCDQHCYSLHCSPSTPSQHTTPWVHFPPSHSYQASDYPGISLCHNLGQLLYFLTMCSLFVCMCAWHFCFPLQFFSVPPSILSTQLLLITSLQCV